jgi:hypothetical protein
MNNVTNSVDHVISEYNLDSDFEYNFDLNPFTYLLLAIHSLVALPYSLLMRLSKNVSDRLRKVQEEQAFRRTFKGPACILK